MIKPQYLLVILLLCFAKLNAHVDDSVTITSDSKIRKNVLRLEFFGKGALYGLYFERKFIRETFDIRLNFGASNFIPNKVESGYSLSLYYCFTKYKCKPFVGLGYTLFYQKYPMPTTKYEREQLLNGTPIDNYPYLREPLKSCFFAPLGIEFNYKKRSSFQIVCNFYAIKQDYRNEYGFGLIPGINYGFNF